MKEKKSKSVWVVVTVIAIAVCMVGLGYLAWYFYGAYVAQNDYNNLDETVSVTYDPQQGNTTEVTLPDVSKKHKNPIDFDKLSKINKDIYSWIKIENTQVDYPVAQSPADDENFYLSKSIYKEYQFAGTIYSQALNKKDYNDRVTVLYGHNMLNGSMFGDLHKFEDAEFFNENKYVYVYTPGHILKYLIYSAYDFDNRHILKNFNFSDDEVFEDYLKQSQNPTSWVANVRNGVTLTKEDKILILSTCSNYNNDSRYLVTGVLVNDEITE